MEKRRFVIVVADSAGCGALPDAAEYGDEGADTIGHVSRAVGGLALPHLGRLGLGHLTAVAGVPPRTVTSGHHGKMRERSPGQGHPHRPLGDDGGGAGGAAAPLPARLPARDPGAVARRHRRARAARQRGGERHRDHPAAGRGAPAHRPAHRLHLGRLGLPGGLPRRRPCRWSGSTPGARWRAASSTAGGWPASSRGPSWASRAPTPAPTTAGTTPSPRPGTTVLERLQARRRARRYGVGKIGDIFDRRGITEEVHTDGNADGLAQTERLLERVEHGLVFVNLVDFDSLYGHRNDPAGLRAGAGGARPGAPAAPRAAAARRPARHHRRPRLRPHHALHRPLARVRPVAGARARRRGRVAGGARHLRRPGGHGVPTSSACHGRWARASCPSSSPGGRPAEAMVRRRQCRYNGRAQLHFPSRLRPGPPGEPHMRIFDDITRTIGNTPLVRLNRITAGALGQGGGQAGELQPALVGEGPHRRVHDRRGRARREDQARHDPARAHHRQHRHRPRVRRRRHAATRSSSPCPRR